MPAERVATEVTALVGPITAVVVSVTRQFGDNLESVATLEVSVIPVCGKRRRVTWVRIIIPITHMSHKAD